MSVDFAFLPLFQIFPEFFLGLLGETRQLLPDHGIVEAALRFPALGNRLLYIGKGTEEIALLLKIDVCDPLTGAAVAAYAGAAAYVVTAQSFGDDQGADAGVLHYIATMATAGCAARFIEASAAVYTAPPQDADRVIRGIAAVAAAFPDHRSARVPLLGGRNGGQHGKVLTGDILLPEGADCFRRQAAAAPGMPPLYIGGRENSLTAAVTAEEPAVLVLFVVVIERYGDQPPESLSGDIRAARVLPVDTAAALCLSAQQIGGGHVLFAAAVTAAVPDHAETPVRAERPDGGEPAEALSG